MNGLELYKYKIWEDYSTTKKHMILMYLYRVETEAMIDLESFIETHRFRQYAIKRSELPDGILSLSAIELRKMAYAVIGKEAP